MVKLSLYSTLIWIFLNIYYYCLIASFFNPFEVFNEDDKTAKIKLTSLLRKIFGWISVFGWLIVLI